MSQDVVLEAAMVSWLEELDRREAAAREKIAELWDQIAELTMRLAEREDVLSRLQITRETMTEILSGNETVSVAGASKARWPSRFGSYAQRGPRGSVGTAEASIGSGGT